ncbi:ankyrin repeat-containing protein [Metarhizium robertsii ARSEF 23]|uniref:Ankyrin repeat-containing protein n=1 Tax=Metarhizium robertsii (strain ARSEF 23 / ATCC MYA-3075) TaxID=655844 RepID=E9F939_METRA|nr:ankyrin repeat-containing protein [Metarhizium robertsii ARSEF 23]EFY95807.2 ankyrin repeat-containing protein [Metarhizium robertsii ARSEF 23]
MALAIRQLDKYQYTVGWIAALPHERAAAKAMLDETHASLQEKHGKDDNSYDLGSISCKSGPHHVVITSLPSGQYGNTAATTAAAQMLSSFPAIKFGLMVGIGGGIWSENNDIRLGDVVVSNPEGSFGGVKQYNSGKATVDGFQCSGWLKPPPRILLNAVHKLRSNHFLQESTIPDKLRKMYTEYPGMSKPRTGQGFVHPGTSKDRLFCSEYRHQKGDKNCDACDKTMEIARKERPDCDPFIHYGTIASGNMVIKDPQTRDLLAQDCLCFETEAAGLMNDFPCLVIRGICDYCDSHKNDEWQNYAAATAAAYAKELLQVIDPANVNEAPRARDGQERKDRDDILEWITRIDYSHQYSDILKRRWEGTGQWLLDSTEFENWLERKGQTLFCSGIPGAGKTVLSAIVVDHLCRKFGNDSSIGIAWLFCEYHRHNEQTLEHLLSSLLKQLLKQQTTLPNCVTELYESHQRRTTRPSIDDIVKLLQSSTATLSRIFVIVDALDECQTTEGCQMDFISKLFTFKDGVKANIFATSRHIDRIQSKFSRCISLEIKATDEDIRMYLKGQRRRFSPDMVSDELQARIESKVIEASADMFLLAAFHMNRLVELKTRQDIINFLESIQESGLDAAYKKTMETIENQDQNSVSLAKRILAWTIYAKRAFSVEELRHVLAVRAGTKQFNPDYMPCATDLLSVCAGLVTDNNESGVIHLIHYTTLEFFRQTRRDWLRDMQADLAETCLTYLLYDCFRVGTCKANQAFEAKFDFYTYAAGNWAGHAGISRPSNAGLARKEKVQPLLDKFLATDPLPPSFLYWLFRFKKGIMSRIPSSVPISDIPKILNLIFSPICWVTEMTGSPSNRDPLEMMDYYGGVTFALLEAFISASLEKARLLLAPCPHPEHWHNLSSLAYEDHPPRDLDDRALGCRKTFTSEAAKSLRGWESTLSALLRRKPCKNGLIRYLFPNQDRYLLPNQDRYIISGIDLQYKICGVAQWLPFFEIHDAPRRCLEEIANLTVIVLLRTKPYFVEWTKEKEKLFRRLLLKPVHKYQEYQYIPMDFPDQDSVLLDFIRLGKDALDFLVRSGVDVNKTFAQHPLGTALAAAVVHDLKSEAPCVKYLLDHGADSNQRTNGREYGSALVAACALGRMDALNLLLQQPNLDINMATQFGCYGTALIAACANGRTDALHLLLQQPNLDINMATQFGCYGTALIAACSNTTMILEEGEAMATNVKYLLKEGAHVNHSTTGEAGAKYLTALAAAVDIGIPRMVQILLNSGAIADERLKNDMPSDSWTARRRWGCLQSHVSHPNTELERTDKEWIDQCTLAARQLSMAIIYLQLEVDASWADEYIPQALYYLRVFSSVYVGEFAAAEITLQQFGFGGKDPDGRMLLSLQTELSESFKKWDQVVACLKELTLEFDEGKIPSRQIDDLDPDFDMLPYSDYSDEISSAPEEW